MKSYNWRKKTNVTSNFKKKLKKGISVVVAIAMIAGNMSFAGMGTINAYADTEGYVISSVSDDEELILTGAAATGTYAFGSGKKVTSSTVYSDSTGYGFSDVTFNEAAKGWVGNVYYQRGCSPSSSTYLCI